MTKATIDYMNARRACKAASGGTVYSREVRPMPEDYEPYNTLPEFDQGISDYMEGRYDNPYTDPRDGVKAQAHDRGSEFAMRVVRYSNR